MNELMINEVRMNHVELCDLINKLRTEEGNDKELLSKNLLAKIRKEVETLKSLGLNTELNFKPSEYKDRSGKYNTTFLMNRDAILEMGASESVYVRAKIIEYVNALEQEIKKYQEENSQPKLPMTYKEALQQLLVQVEENERLEEENKQLTSEVQYKEDVIIGLTQDIDLCTKRQRITQIVRHKAKDNYAQRWNLLYSEFERKYHIDLKRRIANCNVKPKIKNKIDYIERELNMVSELYEIACKIFESDVEELKKEWDI